MLTPTIPDFQFAAFFSAALDYLLANQLAFWLVVLTAFILVYECWLHAVKDAALRRVLRDAKQRETNSERLQKELLEAIYRGKESIPSILERAKSGGGLDNPYRFR